MCGTSVLKAPSVVQYYEEATTTRRWSVMGQYTRPALLVIDVQKGLFEHETPIYEADRLLANIQMLIDRAHAACAGSSSNTWQGSSRETGNFVGT
jgi:hypothetical protein